MVRVRSASEICNELESAAGNSEIRVIILIIGKIEVSASKASEISLAIQNSILPAVIVFDGKATREISEVLEGAHLCFAGKSSEFRVAEKNEPGSTYILSVSEAVSRGLINGHDFDSPLDAAYDAAGKIAKMAPLAVRAFLESIRNADSLPLVEGLEKEIRLFAALFSTNDMKRGTVAFLKKTEPVFEGD
jgi:hypothetical protein